MSRDFTKVSPDVWSSERFRSMSAEEQLLHLYFLTCRHQNSAGCFQIPDGYAIADLGWKLQSYIKRRDKLVEAGLIGFDPRHCLVRIVGWFKYSPPMNPNHRAGIATVISKLPDAPVRTDAMTELAQMSGKQASAANSHLAETSIMRRRRAPLSEAFDTVT